MSEPFLTTIGPWREIDRVPDGHTAVIPGGKHAGVLYNSSDQAVGFLWANDGVALPGMILDIKMVSVSPTPSSQAAPPEGSATAPAADAE